MAVGMEEGKPEVTVVIPVYNGTNYLGEAIESVLAQSYRDFEVLVVDDGSTDETWSLIESYMAAHPRVVRGLRKTNGGVASALNAGILDAKGKYFAWLSHDDRFVPTKLQQQMDLLKNNPEVVGVYADYSYIDAEGRIVGRVYAPWYPQGEMLRHFLQSVFINGSTLVVERRCLLELGLFDETLRYAQDAMMWAHLIMRYPLAHIAEPLTEYRVHVTQTTNTGQRKVLRRENLIWLNRAVSDYSVQQIFPEVDRSAVSNAEVANTYIFLGELFAYRYYDYKSAIKHYWRAWITWPNLHNLVLTRAGKTILRSLLNYYRSRRLNHRFGLNMPSDPNNPIVMDLRSWADSIKLMPVKVDRLESKK